MTESKKRSITKSLSWRIVAMSVLLAVSYIFTQSLKKMTIITLVYTVVQIMVYYIHERIWHRITWGRELHPLEDIPVKKRLSPEDRKEIEGRLRDLGYIE